MIPEIKDAGEKLNNIEFVIQNSSDEEIDKENYAITFLPGTLKVNQRPITITTGSGEWIYNDEPFSNQTFEIINVTPENGPVEGHTFKVDGYTTINNVGEKDNNLSFKVTKTLEGGGQENIKVSNYAITLVCGKLKVTPRKITVESPDDEWIYADIDFYNYDLVITDGTLPEGHNLSLITVTSIRNVGEKTNEITFKIVDADQVDKTSNYDITFTPGTLKVTPKELTIVTPSGTWVYDSEAHYAIDDPQSVGLLSGHKLVAVTYPTITNVGKIENTVVYKVVKISTGENVTGNYGIIYENGEVEVEKAPITIVTPDYSWIYGGGEYSRPEYSGAENKPSGDKIVIDDYPKLNKPGTITNEVKILIEDELTGEDLTSNYEITYIYGTLEVIARSITVKPVDTEKIYDGLMLGSNGVMDNSESNLDMGLVPGHVIVAEVEGGGIEVGVYTLSIIGEEGKKVKILDENGEDVTANYEITVENGTASVKKKSVTITTGSADKDYDGVDLVCEEYEVDGLLAGHRVFVIVFTGAATEPLSTFENTVDASQTVIVDENGVDVTANYDIDYVYGSLVIRALEITVTTPDVSWTYDGEEHFSEDYTLDEVSIEAFGVGGLYESYIVSVSSHTSVTYAGSVDNILEIMITNALGEDVTRYFTVNYVYGTATVGKRPVTVTTESTSFDYDGKYHSHGVYTVTNLVDGHIHIGTNSIEVRDVSEEPYENTIVLTIFEDVTDVTSNYEITYDCGELTVIPRSIIVFTPSDEHVFDGNNHYRISGCVVSDETPLAQGDFARDIYSDYELEYSGVYITYVGSIVNDVEVNIYNSNGTLCTSNYDITYDYGEITVVKCQITVMPTGEWVYDATEHSADNFIVAAGSQDSPVSGHYYIDASTSATITNVGSCETEITDIAIYNLNGEITENYDIILLRGEITVTPKVIEIHSASDSKPYDGEPLVNRKYDVIKQPASSDELSVMITGSITLPGVAKNSMSVEITRDGVDVSSNYTINLVEGNLTITGTSVKILVRTGAASKVYDGTPLTNTLDSFYSLLGGGKLVQGNRVEIVTTGTITDIGVTPNTATVKVYDKDGNDVTEAYQITLNLGTLEVKDEDGNSGSGSGSGSGGSASGGSGKLDASGSLSGNGFDSEGAEEILCYLVQSSVDGKIYLRFKSFGNYNGTGFNAANDYHRLIDNEYSALYLAAIAMQNSNKTENILEIVSKNNQYVLPYYVGLNGEYVQNSDVTIFGEAFTSSSYSVPYYILDTVNGITLPAELEIFEMHYREYVYANYLYLKDDETLALMREIIATEGFDISDPDIIAKVADYISHAADYNLNYNPALDQSENAIVSFLTEYKEGVCRHYAASAVMLYRALGIPARYTIGYVADAKAGEFVSVTAANAHAWVEIYVNGIGWVMVEVTGSSSAPDFSSPEGSGPSWGMGSSEKQTINVSPAYTYKKYDGTALYADNRVSPDELLSELIAKGYTYSVSVSGYRTYVGKSESWIESFTLYDSNGVDVTDNYNIVYNPGVIEVMGGEIIEIFLYELQKYYDGTALVYDSDNYVVITDRPDGITLNVTINISMTEAGRLTNSDINSNRAEYISYSVYDEYGNDITSRYNVVASVFEGMDDAAYVPIRVDARPLELTSKNASKLYDGTALISPEVMITKGSLISGHKLYINASGSITERGSATNTINKDMIRILDADGIDVTDNYDIKTIEGKLTVR